MTVKPIVDRGSRSNRSSVWAVPAINVLLMRKMLLSQNISEVQIFRGTGISPRDIESNESLLTFEQVIAFTANAAKLTKTPGLGLQIGSEETPNDWGALGYAMLSCSSIREVVNVMLQFHQVAASMTDVLFTQEDEFAVIDLCPPKPLHGALATVIEEHMTAMKAAFEMLAEMTMPLIQLNIAYEKPAYYQLYRQYFDCPINFNSPRHQLVFHADFLDSPVSRTNPFNAKLAKNICDQQMDRQVHRIDLISQVRYLILLQGNDFPSAEAISGKLNITSRTLRNQLSRHGTSFQELLDDTRKQLAVSYLESTSMHVGEIAGLLGFSDCSNFRRAFKNWTGCTPSGYRK